MAELIGGIEHRAITIVDYSPAWPARFEQERRRILTALGLTATRIDHVGSTSVPGLAAKPIIDIQLSVPDVEDEQRYLPPLVDAGYLLRVREPGHRMVRTPDLDVQVHICPAGSGWERRHLLFRDWLRRDTADRDAYEALKRDLASHDWPNMNAYADAKSTLIVEIMTRAEPWADANHLGVDCGGVGAGGVDGVLDDPDDDRRAVLGPCRGEAGEVGAVGEHPARGEGERRRRPPQDVGAARHDVAGECVGEEAAVGEGGHAGAEPAGQLAGQGPLADGVGAEGGG